MAARGRGRVGGRPRKLKTNGKVALARRMFADQSHSIPEICIATSKKPNHPRNCQSFAHRIPKFTDLTKRFGNFKLSSEIAIGFNGDIDTALQSALRKIKDAETDEEAGKIAATFARKLIRTCYSMVMTRAQVWTTKLSEQADVFIQYFPEKRVFVRTLQDWVVQPPHNRNDVVAILEGEGSWVVGKFETEARSV